MGEREKVIERLEKAMLLSEAANQCKVTLGYGLVEDIVAMLKAQEPVKPFVEVSEHTGTKWVCCGACKEPMYKAGKEACPNYCSNCGQAVKWE